MSEAELEKAKELLAISKARTEYLAKIVRLGVLEQVRNTKKK